MKPRSHAAFARLFYTAAAAMLAGLVVLAALPGAARAQTGPFWAPTGFALESVTGQTDQHGNPLLFGCTPAPANPCNWAVAAWGIPVAMPSKFSLQPNGTYVATANPSLSVTATPPTGNAPWAVVLAQNGQATPCGGHEYDVYIQPNAATSVYSSANNYLSTVLPTLDHVSALSISGTYALQGYWQSGTLCPDNNHAGIGLTLILQNTAVQPAQTFWYILDFSHICLAGGSDYATCQSLVTNPQPVWINQGCNALNCNTIYGDVMSTYGYSLISDTSQHVLTLNLLPVLTKLLTGSAAHGLDTNLSHWRLTGMNVGDSEWGAVFTSTYWAGWVPAWTTH